MIFLKVLYFAIQNQSGEKTPLQTARALQNGDVNIRIHPRHRPHRPDHTASVLMDAGSE